VGVFQRHMGLDLVDTAIHLAVTVAAAVVASTASVGGPGQEGLVAVVFGMSAIVYGIRRKRALERAPFLADGGTARAIQDPWLAIGTLDDQRGAATAIQVEGIIGAKRSHPFRGFGGA